LQELGKYDEAVSDRAMSCVAEQMVDGAVEDGSLKH
jgi:hypothetical protein